MTIGDCECMSYVDDNGNGFEEVNCNSDFHCTDTEVLWNQMVQVEDPTLGCVDEGGGMHIDGRLTTQCEEVTTHMGTTYQILIDYDPSAWAEGSNSNLSMRKPVKEIQNGWGRP